MNDLENLLRDVLGDLAAEAPAPAPDRADRALNASRARRRSAATVLVAAAAVILVVAGALVLPGALDRAAGPAPAGGGSTGTPQPGAGPAPAEPLPALPVVTGLRLEPAATTGPYQLTSYALRGGGTAVRPPGSAVFRKLPWTSVSVSPTGRIAVVDTTDATPGSRVGIIDSLAAGTIRWMDMGVPVLNPAWSPDGRQVVVTWLRDDSTVGAQRDGFEILDPTRWQIQQGGFAGDDPSDFGVVGLRVGWGHGGGTIVGAVELPDDYSGIPRFGLRSWEPDGTQLSTSATPGQVSMFGTELLSPSGTRVVVTSGRRGIAVADVKTGHVLATPSTTIGIVYGWVDEGHLVAEGAAGLVLLAMDGSTRPYATRVGDSALTRADITHVTA